MHECFKDKEDDRPPFNAIVTGLGNISTPVANVSYYNNRPDTSRTTESCYINNGLDTSDEHGLEDYENMTINKKKQQGVPRPESEELYINQADTKNVTPPPRPQRTFTRIP